MEKRTLRILLGLLALLLCASQALAAPAAPSSMVLPASPDADGVYAVRWYSVSGCSYVLQEDRGAGFVQIYAGSNSYVNLTRPQGASSAFQVKAVNSTGSSAWRAGTYSVVVGKASTPLAPPTALVVPATVDTPTVRITFDGAPIGAGYALERSANGGATWAQVYTGSNKYYLSDTLTNGASYTFRVRSVQYNYDPSSWYPNASGLAVTVTQPQGPAACIACHDGTDTGAPVVAAAWQAGGHANPNSKPLPGSGSCDNCHNVANVAGATTAQITCQGCHGTGVTNHSAGAYTIGNQLTVCNKCHEIYDAAGAVTVADHQNTITDTHFDNPATTVAPTGGSSVEGYVLRKGGATPCSDCHGHLANSAIHSDWSHSAHAGHIAAGPVTDASGVAWTHYNWDDSTGTATDRKSCQRCHTATGVSNFLNAPASYNAANNDFSHLAGWTATSKVSGQNELLYCWGCHSNVESGALRNPGAITETYLGTGTGAPSATINYPNVAASNVCMGCHLGQKIGQNIQDSTGDFTNLSFINSHYLAAGGMVFNVSGYEYAGQSYDSLGYHKSVGVADAYGTGTAGPCVTCHMSNGTGHTFDFLTKNASGIITAIDTPTCGSCHGSLSASALEASSAGFTTALEALKTSLEAKGIFFSTAYPYFYKSTTYTTANAFKNWDAVYPGKGKDVMGAAFNYNLLAHDPGAYAHNRGYALKLIADSCDFLADGAVDGSGIPAGVATTIGSRAFSAATTWVAPIHPSESNCSGCHQGINSAFTTSQHKTREGKKTFFNDHLNDPGATELQKGFGNYVTVAYSSLPCASCHNANDNGPWDTNPAVGTNVQSYPGPNCLDCHTNRPNGLGGAFANTTATTAGAPVLKQTCYGCHSRQVNELNAGLTDVHTVAGMGCSSCHSTSDMHGTGKLSLTQLEHGTITAQCENCHGDGKTQGPLSSIGEHMQHQNNIACSTCHTESMVTCHNCHFDNEYGAPGTTKAKFHSGLFGGTKASGKSWRFLVNRVMADGSTKVYPGSMQSLVADYTDSNSAGDDGQVHTHAGIAPYYTHSITKVNALRCNDCHGTQNAIDLNNGTPIRFNTWNAAAGVSVPAANLAATWTPPKGVIPVPENPTGKILMDFVDLTGAAPLASTSPRVLVQKDGPETIHMPEAYVKPLTALQIQKLALSPHLIASYNADNTAIAAAIANPDTGATACSQCHYAVDDLNALEHYEGLAFHYAQYVISPASQPVVCANCHAGNDVTAHAVIADQFAASAHGNVAGDAWRQYDWRSASRISCQRCHTGTGFVAKLGNETNTSNAFAATDILKPGEVLNCSTCHTDLATGTLRSAPAAFTIGSVSYNVVGASTLCARCHGGRETGAAIAADADADGVRAFISPHYLSAAATVFNAGYEFAGQSYDSLGTNKTLGATGQGPCVTCHMANGNHSLAAAIPVDGVAKKAAIQAGLVNLKAALEAKGIHYSDVHPFFYTAPFVANTSRDGLEGTYNTAFINWAGVYGSGSWKDLMGAAFNYQLLLNEPGAYAHNYDYASKLIADSIDFLNDGAVNGN